MMLIKNYHYFFKLSVDILTELKGIDNVTNKKSFAMDVCEYQINHKSVNRNYDGMSSAFVSAIVISAFRNS